ncbi:MAG TPA: phosphatidate cytidylyltransferase [Acidimicrobiia bacterium]|nr:phosphatidate cytidylyltransferase [Acidimicrobiia bacterium]
MSDRGDDGYEPQPDDPRHSGSADSHEPPEAPADRASDALEPKKRRGLFRRRRHHDDESTETEMPDQGLGIPPEFATGEPVESAASPASPEELGPARLPDTEPDPDPEPTLTVDLPSWASDATAGAEGVAGGFVEPPVAEDDPDSHTGEVVIAVTDVEARLEPDAAAGEDPTEVGAAERDTGAIAPAERGEPDDEARAPIEVEEREVVSVESADVHDDPAGDSPNTDADDAAIVLDAPEAEDDRIDAIDAEAMEEDIEPVDLEAMSALAGNSGDPVEDAAPPSRYGVAGPEAFDALRALDEAADDLSEWAEYAASEDAAVPRDEVPREGPDVESAEERRRGIWPFRRGDDAGEPDGEDIVEEAAEWEDDGTAIPRQWFADIDEDAVVPPAAHLPETEWPVADAPAGALGGEPDSAPPESPGVELPIDASAADELLDEMPARDSQPEEAGGRVPEPEAEQTPWVGDGGFGGEAGPAGADWEREPATPQPLGDAADRSVQPEAEEWDAPAAEGDQPFPDRLELGFDDGTGERDPVRRSAFAGEDEDDDEGDWVTGPIEVPGEHPDEIEESPADFSSVEHLSDAIYRTSATQEHRGLAEEIVRAGEEEREWQAISAAMPGVETGVVGFEDVADLGTEEEYEESRVGSEMGTRVLTGVVLAGFFLGSLWVAPEALAGFIAIVLLLGLGELYATVRRRGLRPLPLFGLLGGAAMLATAWFHGPVAIPATLAITVVVTFFVYAFSPMRRDALTNGGLTVLGLGWVVGTAAFAYPILASEDYRVLVLAIVVVTAAMDIGAFAVGRAWGARALAPVLSPNKSVEGLVGGVGICMLAAAAVGSLLEPFDLMSGVGLGVVVAIAAPLGDLAESMLKRSLGVKDMGSILPGHGGILDRIDALLFVIPAAWVFYQYAGLLG